MSDERTPEEKRAIVETAWRVLSRLDFYDDDQHTLHREAMSYLDALIESLGGFSGKTDP